MYSYYYVDIYGREKILVWGMVLSAISAVGFAIGSYLEDENRSNVSVSGICINSFVILSAMCYSAFSVSSWNSLDCISVETFDTRIRPTSMGVLAAFGRIGAIVAQFIFGYLEHQVLLLLCITAAMMLLGAYCCQLLPETNGKKL